MLFVVFKFKIMLCVLFLFLKYDKSGKNISFVKLEV